MRPLRTGSRSSATAGCWPRSGSTRAGRRRPRTRCCHCLRPTPASAVQVADRDESFRRRFGEWGGGFWLPECAHAAGSTGCSRTPAFAIRCVELTGLFGAGDPRNLQPLRTTRDRCCGRSIARRSRSSGASTATRPTTPTATTTASPSTINRVWANDGSAYDHDRGARAGRAGRGRLRLPGDGARGDGGVCVCALDTSSSATGGTRASNWLAGVVEEADRQGLRLTTLDDARGRRDPIPAPTTSASAAGGRAATCGPGAAPRSRSWRGRPVPANSPCSPRARGPGGRVGERALRELLALQSSDWAFLHDRKLAGDYPVERANGHAASAATALARDDDEPALRNLRARPDRLGGVGRLNPSGRCVGRRAS